MIAFYVKAPLTVLLVALLCHYVVKFLLYLDLNKRVYNHIAGSCSSVAAIENGAEDVEFLDEHSAILSAGLQRFGKSDRNIEGKMFVYNVSARTAWELKLHSKTLSTKNFHPHGLCVLRPKNGQKTIFVINHRKKGDSVEVFVLDDKEKQLNHARTIKSPMFQRMENEACYLKTDTSWARLSSMKTCVQSGNLEDLVCLTNEKFFAVNTHYFKDEFLRNAELYLALPLGNIVYFDGKKSRIVKRWISSPTGIALDISKKWLYVSSMTRERIIVYRIESDYNLTEHSTIQLYGSPDNIFVDPYSADLIVAVHPIKIRKFRHDSDPKNIYSPSQILKIRGRPSKGNWTITQIYANDGAMLSSASVCVKIKDKLLIGSTHDKFLSCDIDYPHLL